MAQWTDDEILEGLRDPGRREDAFRALVASYNGPLRGFLRKLFHGDAERAEDLLGPVFSKVYRRLVEQGGSCRSLASWFFTVAHRTALDDLRKSSTDPLDGALELKEELAGLPTAPAPTEEDGTRQARDAALAEIMTQLGEKDPRYRSLLEMESMGCSRDEIAAATGIDKRQLTPYLKRAQAAALKLARAHPVLADWERENYPNQPKEVTPSKR
jgi:RNA polymerase sigma factor (sigma-70 family)